MSIDGRQVLWDTVEALSPGEACARTGVGHDGTAYRVHFMGREYALTPEGRSVTPAEGAPELLLLAYLVHASAVEPRNEWITAGEIPGGSLFFQGPHALPTAALAARFGADPEAFLEVARSFGGKPLEFGDASASLPALPRIPIAFVLWRGDDEFPAEATVMFDRTISAHFAPDIVLSLVGASVRALVNGPSYRSPRV